MGWLVLVLFAAAAGSPPARGPSAPAGPGGPAAMPSIPTQGRVLWIPIRGDIDLGLAPFVERALRGARSSDVVVLEINTFGGRLDAAVRIRDALLQTRARTVAFINRRAISAGALIALATDVIAMRPGATVGAATPVQAGAGGEMRPVDAKVVSYMRKEMKATAEAKGRRGDIAEAMVEASVEIPGLDTREQTLTLTTEEALRWGVAAFETRDKGAMLARLGRADARVRTFRTNWAERIARFLSSPLMSGLLMTLGMLGILIELYHPSHFAAAGVGLLCLALFFFGHHVTHLAGWEELLLLGIGLALLAVEAFVIPGFGVTGVLGIVAILASLALAIVDLEHVPFHVSWSLGWITQALAIVFGSIAAAAVLIFATGRYLPSTRLGRRFILRAAIGGQPLAPSATPTGIAADDTLVSAELLDRSGRTATVCRPSGKAVIDGRRVDVVAESDYIDKDEPVTVVHVEGARIVVRRQLGGS